MADNKIIRINWDDRMVTNAQNKAKKLGKIRNSILNGGGNAAGYLGEEAVASSGSNSDIGRLYISA